MKTAVLIPCYNESKTIEKVVKDFKNILPNADIYVYDNNSTDMTAQIAQAAGVIVRSEKKQGKGNVVRAMFRDIEADCYIMADGDDTYPASFALQLEKLVLEEGADMAVGDRLSSTYFVENKRLFHNTGNVLVKQLINILFRSNLHDIMTGMRGFSRDFVKSFAVLSQGFEIDTEMTIFALDNNFHIVEQAIEYRDRPEGSESKLNTYSDGFKVLLTIGRLFRDTKPFAFFGFLSIILLFISIFFFLPILINFWKTGQVHQFPTLIIIASIAVIALLNFFCGIILSVLKKQYRNNLERHLYLIRMLKNK